MQKRVFDPHIFFPHRAQTSLTWNFHLETHISFVLFHTLAPRFLFYFLQRPLLLSKYWPELATIHISDGKDANSSPPITVQHRPLRGYLYMALFMHANLPLPPVCLSAPDSRRSAGPYSLSGLRQSSGAGPFCSAQVQKPSIWSG